ncbi:Signal transduction histidine kinase CheA [Hyphomicrobium sulfonivorans]|uniref:Chemotaxis protein CheA n=1 Tax=Hyphomicrobium sulfonivorans TaxID=121290 RepID=A0A120CU85_HYPSL|nr:chemotaxis protein CheA [Hyphomicrobium sulfonivorans]KWT65849.1 Signal transduction histidine kinase CheA [Hyphomicrobium sulfonivorans]
MDSLRQIFFQECEEQLAELESGLLEIEGGSEDPEIVNAVFRAVHSIKGGAGAFALEDLVRFAHVFETVLDEVRKGRLSTASPVTETLLRAADVLADLVRVARDGGNVNEERIHTSADELAALSGAPIGANAEPEEEVSFEDFGFTPVAMDFPVFDGIAVVDTVSVEAEAEPDATTYTITFRPHPSLYTNANEPVVLLRELSRLGDAQIVCDTSTIPTLEELEAEGSYLAWTITLTTTHEEDDVRSIFEFVDGDCDLEIITGNAASSNDEPAGVDDDIAALLARVRGEFTEPVDESASPAASAADVVVDLAGSATAETAAAAIPSTPIIEAEAAKPTPEAAKTPPPAKAEKAAGSEAPSTNQTIRVDLDRVDRLMNLVGELVINQAMLSQRLTDAGLARDSEFATGLDEFEQLTHDIQEGVMAIRAQPVKSVFQRMPRLVREVAAITGKKVRLVTEGEDTEVDKTVIERLADPLTHMIRNAIDHGLESPEKRLAAGKREEGLVRLSASHRSGRIVIDIADDGAGINRQRVRAIAEEKGLIQPNAQLTDEEVDNLIFLPGFSTASTVSDISGRGVGMDVVKKSIQALGGRVSITSRPGEGSTFTLSLPLTLAVLYGMVVTVAEQTLVVPLTSIVETLKPKAGDIHGFGGDSRVISMRNNFLPLIDVGRELGYRSQPADPGAGVALLVESDGGAHSALMVDAIQGQRQIVIKSLEENYGRVPGVAAATILGDGRVALILDVDAIVAASRSGASTSETAFALAG